MIAVLRGHKGDTELLAGGTSHIHIKPLVSVSILLGIIYGLFKGLGGTELIRMGCAVAGMVCEGMPGFINSPTEAELTAFLQSHGRVT